METLQDKKIIFFKNKIKEQLYSLKDELGNLRYKLYCAMVDECNDYDELRDMAELEMQIDTARYNKEIKDKLKEDNTDIRELRMVYDHSCEDVSKLTLIVDSDNEKASGADDLDIAEELQDDDTSAAMALLLTKRLEDEPVEETYRDNVLSLSDPQPSLSDIDSIPDSEFDSILPDDEEDQDCSEEASLFDESDSVDDIEIDESELLGDESSEEEGLSDDSVDDIEIDESELFGEDEESSDECVDEIDIDESELFGDDEDDGDAEGSSEESVDEIDIDESELFGDDEDSEESSGESVDDSGESVDEIDIDESELFGDDEDPEESDGSEGDSVDEIDIDESELFGDDSGDDSDIVSGDDSGDSDDPFSDISESDLDEFEVGGSEEPLLDDTKSFLNKKSSAQPVKRVISKESVFLNGTERGKKTQQMFNWLNGTLSSSEKAVHGASKTVGKAVSSRVASVQKSSMFNLDDNSDELIDF